MIIETILLWFSISLASGVTCIALFFDNFEKITSNHESGHIIMGKYLKLKMNYSEVYKGGGGIYKILQYSDSITKEEYDLKMLLMCLGGPVCEKIIYGNISMFHDRSDIIEAKKIIEIYNYDLNEMMLKTEIILLRNIEILHKISDVLYKKRIVYENDIIELLNNVV